MYTDKLYQFQCVLTPDFSLYLDMPLATKIWNTYRSRLIGQICQREGIDVIPTVSWAEERTFDFCFDGLPKHSTVSVSTVGVKRSQDSLKIWRRGMDEMMARLEPKTILLYGGAVEYDYGGASVVLYQNHVTENWK